MMKYIWMKENSDHYENNYQFLVSWPLDNDEKHTINDICIYHNSDAELMR